MPKKEPGKTSDPSTVRRGESARGKSTKREPARGEAVVGQERAAETAPSAESREAHPEPFARAAATATLAHEQVASRAKEIWERRGCPQGEDEKIWLEAEEQLKQETGVS
jgi:hypothetical protein